MAVVSGPKSPFKALKGAPAGCFWSPRVLSSLWQDTAGTVPAAVDSEVKRMDDLSGNGAHMIAPSGSRTLNDYTYTFKGPILRKTGTQYYLEFDGDGAGLRALNAPGNWSELGATSTFGITMSVAFWTDSNQPSLPSSGFGGTWLGSDSMGNFGNVWWFGLRLTTELMFYCTVRNAENTAWVTQFEEGNRYSTVIGSSNYDRPVIYTAVGTIDNATFGGSDWIDQKAGQSFSGIAFNATTELPQPYQNTFAIGARAPSNDNWIAGRFYGGCVINKEISDNERKQIEEFLYVNAFT